MSKDRPNKVVLKEGFVVLTGDPIAAIVLNQMLYWSERRNDADSFILEELQRETPDAPPPDGSHGWIYKSSEELAGELMGLGSEATIRRKLKLLVDKGWLDERHNPKYAWDRTMQYRPNIAKIQRDLMANGYVLDEYRLISPEYIRAAKTRTAHTNLHSDASIRHSAESKTHGDGALPDITTETTSDITTGREGAPSEMDSDIVTQTPLAIPLFEDEGKVDAKASTIGGDAPFQKQKRTRRTKEQIEADKQEVQPQTPQEQDFFERLQEEARIHNKSGAGQFGALQQARDYREAVKLLNGQGQYEAVLNTALRRGIYAVDKVVGYLHGAAKNHATDHTADGRKIVRIGQRF